MSKLLTLTPTFKLLKRVSNVKTLKWEKAKEEKKSVMGPKIFELTKREVNEKVLNNCSILRRRKK